VRIFDRLLLVLYAIVVGICSIFAVLYGLNWDTAVQIVGGLTNDSIVIVVGILLVIASVRLLVMRTRPKEVYAYVRPNDHGEVRISYQTFESLALKAGNELKGVVDLTAKVAPMADGVQVALRFFAVSGVDIAALTTEMQEIVKMRVETLTGVPLLRVFVYVKDLADTALRQTKPRLQ